MMANKDLEKAEPIELCPPVLTALHPLRRMWCELFQVKTPSRVELSQGERKSPMATVEFEPATFDYQLNALTTRPPVTHSSHFPVTFSVYNYYQYILLL